jgi:sRNA-binding protein
MSDPTPPQASEANPAVPSPTDDLPAPAAAGMPVAEPSVEPAVEPANATAVVAEVVATDVPADPVEAAAARGREPPPTLAQTAARLAEYFPSLFGGPARPIKLRIQSDIQERAPGVFGRRELSLFLHRHTTSTAYLKSMVGLRQRFDLDGAPAGEVAEEHLAAATVELERRWAIVVARRQEQARAQRKGPPRSAPPASTDGTAAPAEAQRPDERPRPPRGPRPAGAERPQGDRTRERTDRPRKPGRPDARPEGRQGDQPPQPQRPRHDRGSPGGPRGDRPRPESRGPGPVPSEQHPHGPARQAAPAATWTPEDQARRDRAQLLRAFESSPLSKTNFCVLKRISESELDAQLAQARAERAAWQREHPPQPRPAR